MLQPELQVIRIFVDTATYEQITMDENAKFVDKLSAIGGALGLFSGFSIISAVEILYFAVKFIMSRFKKI